MAPYIEPLADDGFTPTSTTAQDGGNQPASPYEPIAIIGCGMRLPGKVDNADALFDFLDEKREGRCRVPADRYNIDAFYASNKNGHVGTEHG
jgi:acyl transferase domain-containing protein